MKSSKSVSLVFAVLVMFLFAGTASADRKNGHDKGKYDKHDKKHRHDKDRDKHKRYKIISKCDKEYPSLSADYCTAKGGTYSEDKYSKKCVVEEEKEVKCFDEYNKKGRYGKYARYKKHHDLYKAIFVGPTTTYYTDYEKKGKYIFEKCRDEVDDKVEIAECYQWVKYKDDWKRIYTWKCKHICKYDDNGDKDDKDHGKRGKHKDKHARY